MTSFEREYQRLNAAQQKAVDIVDGPLLVIAGPGTGKTQLLSLRVANILDKTDTSPENILCLTFTNKAANNMRQRLGGLIGPAGNRVPVRTFHSFASELMSTYPEYFWNGAQLTHVPEAVQLEIITDILGSLPLNNPLALKFAGTFTATREVQNGLKLAKEAGLTPDKLRSLIELNLSFIDLIEPQLIEMCSEKLSYKKLDDWADKVAALPSQNLDENTRPLVALTTVIAESFENARAKDEGTNKTTHVSKWKAKLVTTVNGQKGMYDERKRNAWWLALCDVYAQYRDHLHKRGYYDYADMIIEVITQLEQSADMLASVQEHYQYVLIDEFQDTNAAQLRLAHLIADHYSNEGKPNIMAVGDDDQSIYKFNGAELSNMLDFRRSYPAAALVVLTDNYRSSQAILDFSEQVITQAIERVATRESDIQKLLTAQNAPAAQSAIRHVSYPTAQHHYYGLAEEVKVAFDRGDSVAVLARSHESLKTMAAPLHTKNVPIRYEQRGSIFDLEAVQQIILVTRIADAIATGNEASSNEYVAQLLRHPVWQISPDTLWRLAVANRHSAHWLTSLTDHADAQLQSLGQWLLWLGAESGHTPLPRMLEYIIGLATSEHLTSPIRHYFLAQTAIDTPYLATLSGTHRLIELAQEFCQQGQTTVRDFVRLIEVAEENSQTIADESLFVSAPRAVELLTVYKAKGLEFDSVFIVDAMDSIWRPNLTGRKPPMNLPLKPHGDDMDDYIRLMFVAITRAKRDVTIGSYYTNSSGIPVLPYAIIRDILEPERIEVAHPSESIEVLESTLAWPRLEGSKEKLLLGEALESYSLSATALLNFLDVSRGGPQYFLERHLLRLPEAPTTASSFGSAIHAALEYAQQLARTNAFDLKPVLTHYETALQKQYLGAVEQERYLAKGHQLLRQLFEDYGMQLSENGLPEVALRDIYLGKARIMGNLDRVDQTDNTLLVTDYKTGKPLSSLTTHDKTKQIKAWRHRSQLQFYVLLANTSNQFKHISETTAQMVYVEAETSKDLVRQYTPSQAELDRLAELLQIVWAKITSLNLPDVRHYDQSYQGIEQFEQDLLDGKI